MNTALLALLFQYNNAAAVQPARGWPPAISLQICREIWKNPGFLTIQGLSPCITLTRCFPGGASRLHVAGRYCWGPCSMFAQDLSLGWLREAHCPPGALAQISMTTDLEWRPGMLSDRRSLQQKKPNQNQTKPKMYGGGGSSWGRDQGASCSIFIILQFSAHWVHVLGLLKQCCKKQLPYRKNPSQVLCISICYYFYFFIVIEKTESKNMFLGLWILWYKVRMRDKKCGRQTKGEDTESSSLWSIFQSNYFLALFSKELE